ncbi:MAG: hypothetical protein ACOY93_10260 [Bacillota bacterium]
MWQRVLAAAAIGLMLAGPVSGCARPQRQPEPQASPAELGASVARIAALDNGAGETAAVVFDNNALIALQLNLAQPGGTHGQSVAGPTSAKPDNNLSDPGKGVPLSGSGPGGSTGVLPARPGGGFSPGGTAPGGSPVRTQAAPNAAGGPATDAGTNTPIASPGSLGITPLDMMHRIANQVKTRMPSINEVRFATAPADARRVEAIAREIAGGAPLDGYRAELAQLFQRAVPAGVTEFDPMHPAPANNSRGAPGPTPQTPSSP